MVQIMNLGDILNKSSKGLLRFIYNKNEYCLFGEDAVWVKEKFPGTKLLDLQNITSDGITRSYYSISVTKTQLKDIFEKALKEMLFDIEVWAYTERGYILESHSSPGNIASLDALIPDIDINTSMSVLWVENEKDKTHKMRFLSADTIEKSMSLSIFEDKPSFSCLGAVLIQCNVTECLLIAENIARLEEGVLDLLTKALKVNGVKIKKLSCLYEKSAVDWKNVVNYDKEYIDILFEKYTSKIIQSCVNYLSVDPEEVFSINIHRESKYMKIDTIALRALNILPKSNKDDGNLYSIMNKCMTKQGGRLLNTIIRNPLLSEDDLNIKYSILDFFINETQLREATRERILRPMPDIYRLSKKLETGNLSIKMILSLYNGVCLSKELQAILREKEENNGIVSSFLERLEEIEEKADLFCTLIENTIDIELANRHEYVLRDEGDPEMDILKTELNNLDSASAQEFENTVKTLGESGSSLKLEYNSQTGYYFRIPRGNSKAINGNWKYIKIAVLKNGVHFKTSELTRINEERSILEKKKQNIQKRREGIFMDDIRGLKSIFEVIADISANIDVSISFAVFCTSFNQSFTKPVIVKERKIILKDSRHPLIESQGIDFVSNDIELLPKKRFQIITGPNTCGKSTYIRQAGISVFLAQIGCFVPASYAELSIFDSIFARVGASDNHYKGMSTFMVEMTEMATMLQNGTEKSLLIIDELGRGTSISDGYGLAYAISKEIIQNVKCFCFFATHFHEITMLENELEGVGNFSASVLIEENSFIPMYKILNSPCNKSFGVDVAAIAGFPEKILLNARKKSQELENGNNLEITEEKENTFSNPSKNTKVHL
eukprot:GHVP01028281.1.p1 GENE.GHVP01028281.1~~GHVP01028281.1.p1  ORF type:complete len:838 (+),score=143.40 GHVP01028281.1:721-3234(+)